MKITKIISNRKTAAFPVTEIFRINKMTESLKNTEIKATTFSINI